MKNQSFPNKLRNAFAGIRFAPITHSLAVK